MEKNKNESDLGQAEAFWLNEIQYFENAQEALKKCYAIISSLKDHAHSQLTSFAPAREEVEIEK